MLQTDSVEHVANDSFGAATRFIITRIALVVTFVVTIAVTVC